MENSGTSCERRDTSVILSGSTLSPNAGDEAERADQCGGAFESAISPPTSLCICTKDAMGTAHYSDWTCGPLVPDHTSQGYLVQVTSAHLTGKESESTAF